MKRTFHSRMLTVLAVVASLGAFTPPVDARTLPASAGKAESGGQESAFNTVSGVVYRTTTVGSSNWIIPLVFDLNGARTIRVRGRCPANGQMTCSALAFKTDGTLASSAAGIAFPSNNTHTFVDLFLSSVPAGATGSVSCLLQGTTTCNLYNVDYTP